MKNKRYICTVINCNQINELLKSLYTVYHILYNNRTLDLIPKYLILQGR